MYTLKKKLIREITDQVFPVTRIEPAEVIFIPGCARPEHTEAAAELYHKGYAPILVPSGKYAKTAGSFAGVASGGEKYGNDYACEADFLSEVLIRNGVPEEAVLKETEATYTLENAERSRELLDARGLLPKTAILCCKAHHSGRALMYYSMVFPETDIMVFPVVYDGISRENWFLTPEGRKTVLEEHARIGAQLLMMEGRIDWNV